MTHKIAPTGELQDIRNADLVEITFDDDNTMYVFVDGWQIARIVQPKAVNCDGLPLIAAKTA